MPACNPAWLAGAWARCAKTFTLDASVPLADASLRFRWRLDRKILAPTHVRSQGLGRSKV